MRLTCPNCGAQYEVPDAVIPVAGRDVQCSNCGTTWFQHHPDHAPAESADPAEPGTGADTAPGPDPEEAPDPGPRPAPGTGRRLDPSVADILREEADRERAARAADADGRIETQPDLGLEEPEPDQARRAREARDRMQRLRGERPADTARTPPQDAEADRDDDPDEIFDDEEDERLGAGSRRNLFPDIEEINSSLSASGYGGAALAPTMSDDPPPARAGGGFRAGFRLAVVAGVAALAVYLMAPRIAGLWPAAEAPLAQYVEAVDGVRGMLSTAVADLLARL